MRVCSVLSKYVLHLSAYSVNFPYEEKWPNPFCMYRKYESGNASVSSECNRVFVNARSIAPRGWGQCIPMFLFLLQQIGWGIYVKATEREGGYLPERSKKCNPWPMKNNFVYGERYIIYFKQDKPDELVAHGFLWSLLWWQTYLELHIDGSVTVSKS